MTVLRIRPCNLCRRRAETTERNGGWTVDCYYSHPFHAVDDHEAWCDVEYSGELFDTPNEAILSWNERNPISGWEHQWENVGTLFDGISAWYCRHPNCSAHTIELDELVVKDCIGLKPLSSNAGILKARNSR
ncbi:MAG: hypothetical protein KAR20_02010 [Candidatus Heimdallarchaeota archaeon]|nr:hypothetical protein [Candidatus Heimdallarchaeota archaeon]